MPRYSTRFAACGFRTAAAHTGLRQLPRNFKSCALASSGIVWPFGIAPERILSAAPAAFIDSGFAAYDAWQPPQYWLVIPLTSPAPAGVGTLGAAVVPAGGAGAAGPVAAAASARK